VAKKKGPEEKERRARKQIGVKLDVDLWREIRVLAVETDRTAGELLEEAMREHLERHRRARK
jgi:predicted transcriptional regulator